MWARLLRLLRTRNLLALCLCWGCTACGIYGNAKGSNYGWSEYNRDLDACLREHSSEWVETSNLGGGEYVKPEPEVLERCLASKGWYRTNAYASLNFLFSPLPGETRP
jgi:hypothetical protein